MTRRKGMGQYEWSQRQGERGYAKLLWIHPNLAETLSPTERNSVRWLIEQAAMAGYTRGRIREERDDG
jgi:hypothetical protein